MDKIKTLKRYNIFKNLEENEVMPLLNCFRARVLTISKGQEFISSGNKIEKLYIIISGIAKDESFDQAGNRYSYTEYTDGDIIGILPYTLGRKTYPNDVISLTEMKVLEVDAFRFLNPCQNYCPRHTKVMQNVIAQLSKQTAKIESHVKETTKKTTREKILSYINKISKEKKSKEFDIPYTHQELANYLGVERSALSLELSKLKKEKVLSYKGKHYILY